MDRSRRGFLAGMLAMGAAPAIVKASSLMPVFARKGPGGLLVPTMAEYLDPTMAEYLDNGILVHRGNLLLTPAMITKEALRIIHMKLPTWEQMEITKGITWPEGQPIKVRKPDGG